MKIPLNKASIESLGDELRHKFKEAPSAKFSAFGLCSTCANMFGTITQYSSVRVYCVGSGSDCSIRLSSVDPVLHCTTYRKRGELSLYDLKEMAWYIDPKKSEVGFIHASEILDGDGD